MIDKDILGWAKEHGEELAQRYQQIIKVGEHPELPQRSPDTHVASYCRDNNSDLLTSDKNAYTTFFDVGVTRVLISRDDWWKEADKPVYHISIS